MPSQDLDPAVYYKNDLCVTFDGTEKCVPHVLPVRSEYDLKLEGYGPFEFFSMTTCHQEHTSQNKKRFFKKNNKMKVTYIPSIEKRLSCPLYLSAYNTKERNAWNFIAFEKPEYTLRAKIKCNGEVEEAVGVSTCQTREGILTEIEFDEVVSLDVVVNGPAEREKDCEPIGTSAKKWSFLMPNRECIYGFKNDKGHIHQLFTIGYEEIIIRGK